MVRQYYGEYCALGTDDAGTCDPHRAHRLFEGAYNHVLKNTVYFAGAPSSLLHILFPPSMYELPNSLFFEMTGVMQLVAAAVTARRLYRLLVASRRTV